VKILGDELQFLFFSSSFFNFRGLYVGYPYEYFNNLLFCSLIYFYLIFYWDVWFMDVATLGTRGTILPHHHTP
jgi:hypothetical protein